MKKDALGQGSCTELASTKDSKHREPSSSAEGLTCSLISTKDWLTAEEGYQDDLQNESFF